MRSLKKPPRSLRLSSEDTQNSSGELVKWASTAATRAFRLRLTLWALRSQKRCCAYCSLPVGRAERRSSALDHFVSKGGPNGVPRWTYEPYNLVLACESCNGKFKTNKSVLASPASEPYRKNRFRLFHPYLDRVEDHIRGGYRGGAHTPSTPVPWSDRGRATVELFDLLDPNLRRVWDSESQRAKDNKRRRDLSPAEMARFEAALAELRGQNR